MAVEGRAYTLAGRALQAALSTTQKKSPARAPGYEKSVMVGCLQRRLRESERT
jgi:hypothetical protein